MEHKLTSKDKAYLKGLANSISDRYLMGKEDASEGFFDMIDKALEAKELIKIGILQNSSSDAKEVAKELEKRLKAQTVQIIGRVIVLYRASKKNPTIKL